MELSVIDAMVTLMAQFCSLRTDIIQTGMRNSCMYETTGELKCPPRAVETFYADPSAAPPIFVFDNIIANRFLTKLSFPVSDAPFPPYISYESPGFPGRVVTLTRRERPLPACTNHAAIAVKGRYVVVAVGCMNNGWAIRIYHSSTAVPADYVLGEGNAAAFPPENRLFKSIWFDELAPFPPKAIEVELPDGTLKVLMRTSEKQAVCTPLKDPLAMIGDNVFAFDAQCNLTRRRGIFLEKYKGTNPTGNRAFYQITA